VSVQFIKCSMQAMGHDDDRAGRLQGRLALCAEDG
jgi:hypothetical protein